MGPDNVYPIHNSVSTAAMQMLMKRQKGVQEGSRSLIPFSWIAALRVLGSLLWLIILTSINLSNAFLEMFQLGATFLPFSFFGWVQDITWTEWIKNMPAYFFHIMYHFIALYGATFFLPSFLLFILLKAPVLETFFQPNLFQPLINILSFSHSVMSSLNLYMKLGFFASMYIPN